MSGNKKTTSRKRHQDGGERYVQNSTSRYTGQSTRYPSPPETTSVAPIAAAPTAAATTTAAVAVDPPGIPQPPSLPPSGGSPEATTPLPPPEATTPLPPSGGSPEATTPLPPSGGSPEATTLLPPPGGSTLPPSGGSTEATQEPLTIGIPHTASHEASSSPKTPNGSGINEAESNTEEHTPIISLTELSKIINGVFSNDTYTYTSENDITKKRVDALVKVLQLYKSCVKDFSKDTLTTYFEKLEAYREYVAKLCYIIVASNKEEQGYTENFKINKIGDKTNFTELNALSEGLYNEVLTELWSDEPKKFYFAMYKGVLNGDSGEGDAGVLHIMNALCHEEKETNLTFKSEDFTRLLEPGSSLPSNLTMLKDLCNSNPTKMYETYEDSMFINYAFFFSKALNLNNPGTADEEPIQRSPPPDR